MVPGLYGYESGQPATGDLFEWFAGNAVPREYYEKAGEEGKSILEYLGDLAADLEPGESGLIALDWFNGNRSVLSNYNLSGAIIGLTLHTKTEEIYRALVEANIFGSGKFLRIIRITALRLMRSMRSGGLRGRVRGLCRCARTYSIRRL